MNKVQNTASGKAQRTFITGLWTRQFGKVDPIPSRDIIIIVSSSRRYTTER